MTELEKTLLAALQTLLDESEKQHTEYLKSAKALWQMFDNTKKKNDEIETLLKDLSERLKDT